MKLIIPNRDIEDPDGVREVVPLALDLDCSENAAVVASPDFSTAIAAAAKALPTANRTEQQGDTRRRAQAIIAAARAELAAKLARECGLSLGGDGHFAYKSKPKVAYNLWKRVIPMLIDVPDTQDMSVSALAKMLNDSEPNYTITRDMMYDQLNALAEKDLKRLLKKRGDALTLVSPITIASVRKALIERRNAALGLEEELFSGDFQIRGDTVYVNGKAWAIQLGNSGGRRIKRNGRWLNLDALKDFCLG
jgi:hypothetical protein